MSDNIDRTEQMRQRTKEFGFRILHAFRSLDKSRESQILGGQMLRAGTSVPANYRAACRARSRREFIAKLGTVCEESDETEFWLGFFIDAGMLPRNRTTPLHKESKELAAIFSASLATAKARNRKKKDEDK